MVKTMSKSSYAPPDTNSPTWVTGPKPGTRWWPEYDRRLGAPTSPPNTRLPGKRWKYARNFSSGTTVYVDVATRVVEIRWA